MNTLIDSFLQETFEESTNDIIDLDLNNPDNIIIVQNLTNFFSEPTLVSTVPKSTQRKIIHSVDMMIMRMIDGEVPVHNNIMKLIDLSLSLNLSILKNKKILKLRNIFEESDDKEEIDNVIKLLENLEKVYKKMTLEDIENGIYNIFNSEIMNQSSGIYIQRYSNLNSSIIEFKKQTINNNLTYVNLSECINDNLNTYLYISINIPSYIASLNLGNVNSNSILFSAYDLTNKFEMNITSCDKIKIYFSLPDLFNISSYSYFKEKDIDIYNYEDEAFTKKCYINSKFEKDYPNNYRRTKIYSGKEFNGLNNCNYEEIDINDKKVIMNCKYSENGYGYIYQDKKLEKINNNFIPLKCSSLISSLFKKINYAIIVYLIIFIFILLFSIYSCFQKKKKFKENKEISQSSDSNKIINDENIDIKDTKLSIDNNGNNSFYMNFKEIFLNTHPLFSIFSNNQFFFSYLFFSFILINYFGFNAIYYSETQIERRINDKDSYSIINEITKIVLSLFSSMILTLLLKIISKYCSKIVSFILIIIIGIFFSFYSSIFCILYKYTQNIWIISSFICIFLDFLILSPILILIITFISMKLGKLYSIIKDLFPF